MEYQVISFALLSLREPLRFTIISSFFFEVAAERKWQDGLFWGFALAKYVYMDVGTLASSKWEGGGAVAFWMSMLKCLAPRDADACRDLQGTSLWEEKLVRLFAAASTNTHYTHLCWVLQMAQIHKRYWVINKQNNTNKMLTNFCRCSSSCIQFALLLGKYLPLKLALGRALLSSLTLIKIFCIHVYTGQFFSLMGLSWWASPVATALLFHY